MSTWEWCFVILLNGSIVGYGLYLGRGGQSSSQWFLAGRALPWWLMGLSMYATAINAADLVAGSGATYLMGFSYFVISWIGVVGGWALAGFFIFVPMYRRGMYTNAEYLEARFGAGARITSVFVQVQFRTLVMGMMSISIFRILSVVCGWDWLAWSAVVLVAALAAAYNGRRWNEIGDGYGHSPGCGHERCCPADLARHLGSRGRLGRDCSKGSKMHSQVWRNRSYTSAGTTSIARMQERSRRIRFKGDW